jgi:hypothetical protein
MNSATPLLRTRCHIPGVGKEAPSSLPALDDPPLSDHTRPLVPQSHLNLISARMRLEEIREMQSGCVAFGNSSPPPPVSHPGCGQEGAELPSSAE